MKEQIRILINKIFEQLIDKDWSICKCAFYINGVNSRMIKTHLEFLDLDNRLHLENKMILIKSKKLKSEINSKYETRVNDLDARFNHLEIEIYPDGSYKEYYWWDDQKEYEQKLMSAKYFYNYTNNVFMSGIFEYELEHLLLTPIYDDNEIAEYESSWDNGVFSFKVLNNEVEISIELMKDGKTRKFDNTYFESFKKDILTHYKITNSELKKDWKPWNTLIIKSPNNEISITEVDKYVTYSLEEII